MLGVFYEEKLITALMFLFLLLSMLGRIMIGILYQNMIKETENMSATKNKALKQCKLKFSNCYQLNGGVANIPIFVDKFIGRLRLGPLSFQTIYHLSGQMMLLSVFFAGVGICKCIMAGYSVGAILPFYIASFLGLYLYFSVSAIADIRGRRRMLKTNLVDYLENHMVGRLSKAAYPGEEDVRAGRRNGSRESKGGIELMPLHGGAPEASAQTAFSGQTAASGQASFSGQTAASGQAAFFGQTAFSGQAAIFGQENPARMAEDAGAGETWEERGAGGTGDDKDAGNRTAKGRVFTLSEEKELEALLKEFLTS